MPTRYLVEEVWTGTSCVSPLITTEPAPGRSESVVPEMAIEKLGYFPRERVKALERHPLMMKRIETQDRLHLSVGTRQVGHYLQ